MKRKVALAMAVCMAIGMLTGCGGPKEAGKAGETNAGIAQTDGKSGESNSGNEESQEAKTGNDG